VEHDDSEIAERRSGKSLRLALLMLAITALGAIGMGYVMRPAPPTRVLMPARVAASVAPRPHPARANHDAFTYRVQRDGHFYVDAEVNGATVRFLVDTGATSVALTTRDARAAGFSPDALRYDVPTSTANGETRNAAVRLREVRIGQLSVENVSAVVMSNSNISLLGMSFLSRLDSYRISDGVLTMEW
jgi:aspartyl protease family protein